MKLLVGVRRGRGAGAFRACAWCVLGVLRVYSRCTFALQPR